jgi:hypothetical protein
MGKFPYILRCSRVCIEFLGKEVQLSKEEYPKAFDQLISNLKLNITQTRLESLKILLLFEKEEFKKKITDEQGEHEIIISNSHTLLGLLKSVIEESFTFENERGKFSNVKRIEVLLESKSISEQ